MNELWFCFTNELDTPAFVTPYEDQVTTWLINNPDGKAYAVRITAERYMWNGRHEEERT